MTDTIYIQEDGSRREATPEEIEQFKKDLADSKRLEAERKAAEEEKENLKASANAKLAALGLTANEIAAITS